MTAFRSKSKRRSSSPGIEEGRAQDRERLRKKPFASTLLSNEGWEPVPAEQRWDFLDPYARTHKDTTLSLSRHVSKAGVFRALLPPGLVWGLCPAVDVDEAYAMWSFMAFVIASEPPVSHPSQDKNKEQTRLVALRADVSRLLGTNSALGVTKFKRLQSELLITPEFARERLSPHLASLVASWGETVALDEKMRTWRGYAPHYMSVPSKPDPKGQWTTQLVVRLQDVEFPFCIGLFPFDSAVHEGESVELNEIWGWVRRMLPMKDGPCIIADSYYMTWPMLRTLIDDNIRFVCAVKTHHFKEYTSILKRKADDIRKTAVLYNPSWNTMAVHHFDKDVGRKYVLTNSLTLSESRRPEPGLQMAYWLYRNRFSYCDEFNRSLHGFKYPFRRSTWQKNFDSLFVSTLVINCYHAWLYANPDNRCDSLVEFSKQLGLELISCITSS